MGRPHRPSAPPKAKPGDKIAVLSTSFAAPAAYPAVHEQAMARLAEITGLEPVEFPTTRAHNPSAEDRAADINAAFADPTIRAIHAVVGGDDQITVVPHLDADSALADPKPFIGYSDNTHLHNWLWGLGISSFYGGSTQVHLGPGPEVDEIHERSLLAALIKGGAIELTRPDVSEDFGFDWGDPSALTKHGDRRPTDPYRWLGPRKAVSGRTWGGCLEVLADILAAGRFPFDPSALAGGILLVETSEELPSPAVVHRFLRAMGERGLLKPLAGIMVAQPPVSSFTDQPDDETRRRRRAEQADAVERVVERYCPHAVVAIGVPFGHTRPQWIVPYGGRITLDGMGKQVTADYL